MRSDEVEATKWCAISPTASSGGVGSAAQIAPRHVAAGIEVVQPPAGAPGWVQPAPDMTIDPQPVLPPSLGTMARRRPSSRKAEPTRRGMIGA
jgi:hypothetical protein